MRKIYKSIVIVLLCVVSFLGCAKSEDSFKTEDSSNSPVPSMPVVSASPKPVKADINVAHIDGISEDFIYGIDISDIKSKYDDGIRYFDFDGNELFYAPEEGQKGFCTFLKECGINWVQIRMGHNSDELEVVKEIGKSATDAGLRVLIDLYYQTEEEWQGMNIEEKTGTFKEYTIEVLTELIDYGVDIGMVQIDNKSVEEFTAETDFENICTLVNGGCGAIRYVADTVEKEMPVVLHFTGIPLSIYEVIAKTLEDNQVDYDIFGVSYTYSDKTIQNIVDVMTVIIDKYGKKVMLTEEKMDVYALKGKKAVQKRINAVTDMIQSVVNMGEDGIGVFCSPTLFNYKGVALKSANMFKDIFTGTVNISESY